MSSHQPIRFPLLFLSILALITACNNATQENRSTEKDSATQMKNAKALAGGKLYVLAVDSASFAKLPNKKVVFVMTFRQNDTLTLHGWVQVKDSMFGDYPDIELKEYKPDSLDYGSGMYYGNVVLQNGGVRDIKKALKDSAAQTVLFTPKLVLGNHIGYDITVCKGNVIAGEKASSISQTIAGANPSPPKGY